MQQITPNIHTCSGWKLMTRLHNNLNNIIKPEISVVTFNHHNSSIDHDNTKQKVQFLHPTKTKKIDGEANDNCYKIDVAISINIKKVMGQIKPSK